ncbi:MAG: TonB-dependent receptor, partial [Geobacteraceae bacterium]|nr:TonB-dependent receptor [Geobacteraceae bacterium]
MSKFTFQHSLRALLTAICLICCLLPAQLRAAEPQDDTLGLFSAWQESASSATRSPKPLSQTAENITVVTADEIRGMNAHTLADVLDTIPGIQLQHNGGPGIVAYTQIQSASFNHTKVFVDGVSITDLGSNFSYVSLIPAGIIERVEVVKGSASAAWGSALAGVINVITKAPEAGRPFSGAVSAAIGERTSYDSNLELSGSNGRLGYYLAGGFLGSNGVMPNTQDATKDGHARLTWALPDGGNLSATFNRFATHQGTLFAPAYDLKQNNETELLFSSLVLTKPLSERLTLEAVARHSLLTGSASWFNISDGLPWSQQPLPTGTYREQTSGADLRLIWRNATQLLVLGGEYNHLQNASNSADATNYSPYNRTADRWGAYLNDTISLGAFSFTPGGRFDHTQNDGDHCSYSLGGTWQATDTTLLRAYAARGFGIPFMLNVDYPSEKIWTTQVGVESTALPYLWLKQTFFRNETWGPNIERNEALGAETELRSTPLWHTSLGGGYTFTDTTRDDGTQVNYAPRHTLKLSLRYDDQTYRALLTGSHIYWNAMPGDSARYGGLLWDLHLGAYLFKRQHSSLEIFFSGHNLFNNGQYYTDQIQNPRRWFEGG